MSLALAACAPATVDMMEKVPPALRGAAWVADVDLSFGGSSRAEVAAADRKLAERRPAPDPAAAPNRAGLPFAKMLVATIQDVARARGLASGRAVRVMIEIDRAHVAETAAAALGRADRLAGQVRILDAHDGAPLGSFYVDVDKVRPGLLGLAMRGTGVREKLAEEFAQRIADQLAAPH